MASRSRRRTAVRQTGEDDRDPTGVEMQLPTLCFHCPLAWWGAAGAVAIAVILLAAGLLFWRKDTIAWRAAGGLLFIVVTLICYVTTAATLRYGVNITGTAEESRRHVLEIGVLLALYVPVWLLLLHHRRLKSPSLPRAL